MAPHRTLVISDVHLCGVVEDVVLNMPHRQRANLLDDDLAALINDAVSKSHGASLDIVLNGDLFDFDAPDVHSNTRSPAVVHEESGATALINKILNDHPVIVQALRNALATGANVVFVPGNHDAELAFPAVRSAITARLISGNVPGKIRFQSWFYRTPDGFHIEHGHQYDPTCMLENPLPVMIDGHRYLEETVGSTLAYYAQALFGQTNPYSNDPFNLGPEDISSAIRQCTVDRCAGSAVELIRKLASVNAIRQQTPLAFLQAAQLETNTDPALLQQHLALFAPKVSIEQFVATGGWKNHGKDTENRLRMAETEIARIYKPSGVIMGHTHRPFGEYVDGVFFGNTGFWASDAGMASRRKATPGSFVWIDSGRAGTYSVNQ